MNIGIVVSPENPVPPVGYGGAERVANVMTLTLMQLGHRVTLFCVKGSTCPASMMYMTDPGFNNVALLARQALDMLHDKRLDVVIDYGSCHFTNRSAGPEWPVISIMGGDPFKKYPHDAVTNRVYASPEFAAFYDCPNHPSLGFPICMEPEKVPCGPGGGPAVFVGPIHAIKGIEVPAAACKRLGETLAVYGPIRAGQESYWESVKNEVDYCGVLYEQDKNEVLGHASVFCHATQVCDADPGAPKEAMLRGTPTVACPNGGIVGRIKDGKNGYFANSPPEFAVAIKLARQLDREYVRQSILDQCDPLEFGKRVEALCIRAVKGERW